jgi:hypothetical protein
VALSPPAHENGGDDPKAKGGPTACGHRDGAEVRLHKKFMRLVMKGKRSTVAVVAVARELAGFVWAIGQC